MFALALWDENERQLLLARDRFGKKPLYYADLGDALLFGSELKALLQHPRCPRELDFASLSRYLALEYVPTPRAIFEGVSKLPGGHFLLWRDGRRHVEQYWDLSFESDAGNQTRRGVRRGVPESASARRSGGASSATSRSAPS